MKKLIWGCALLLVVVSGIGADSFSGGGNSSGNSSGSTPSWLNITDPTSVSFVWRNQGTSTVTTNSTQKSIFLAVPAGSGDNIRGREIAAPAPPVSITVGLIPLVQNQNFNQCGIYVTDGTKLLYFLLGTSPSSMNVAAFNNVTTFSSNVSTPGLFPTISPIFLKILDNGTNLVMSWSADGIGFNQIYNASRTAFLASISAFGFACDSNNASFGTSELIISWTQGTS